MVEGLGVWVDAGVSNADTSRYFSRLSGDLAGATPTKRQIAMMDVLTSVCRDRGGTPGRNPGGRFDIMNLDALIPFEQVLEEALRDPEFRAEWDRLAPARAMANRLIAYRAEHGLNQTGSGRVLGVSQPAVARLEAGEHLPSLPTLLKLAEALDAARP
jgi:DNA-binding XRE family transcriptional regulator